LIYYVTGPLGSGKSTYGARKMGRGFLEGRVVATNVQLPDDWARIVARKIPHYRFLRTEGRAKMIAELESRYLYEPDVFKLVRTRIKGKGEGRGIMVVDEAHNRLNNRNWKDADQIQFLSEITHARKRGWTLYLIAQHADNTDISARRVASAEIKLVNWRQLTRVPILGTPMIPFPLFLAMAYPLNVDASVRSSRKPLWRELFLLGWTRHLFDTFQEFLDDGVLPPGVAILPRSITEHSLRDATLRLDAMRRKGFVLPEGTRSLEAAASPNGTGDAEVRS